MYLLPPFWATPGFETARFAALGKEPDLQLNHSFELTPRSMGRLSPIPCSQPVNTQKTIGQILRGVFEFGMLARCWLHFPMV